MDQGDENCNVIYENGNEEENFYNELPSLSPVKDLLPRNDYSKEDIFQDLTKYSQALSGLNPFEFYDYIESDCFSDEISKTSDNEICPKKRPISKYVKYEELLKMVKDKNDLLDSVNDCTVKNLINQLRNEYSQKLVKCSKCGHEKSIDIAFRDNHTKKVMCRDCAKNRNYKHKPDLLDYFEEEVDDKYCFRCKRCHKNREINQFRVIKRGRKYVLTYCKFCSNLRYLSHDKIA